jgi:murein DD-endopeptidase MepM/ murein hydrolase activator NlpD
MRRLVPALAAALMLAASPHAAVAQTFHVVAPATSLPTWETPNASGSITVPFALSSPPASPAVRSYDQLLRLWQDAGDAYGVPWQVLAAINKIESNFGGNMGPSSAGAVGWMQFMPSTWMRWGMDADGDGLSDPWNPDDAVYAAARYLAAAGAHDDIERAVFAYNHAQWYVDEVMNTAALFGEDSLGVGSSGLVFQMADLEGQLAGARTRIARAKRGIQEEERRLVRLADVRLVLERRAGNPRLSDEHFRRVEGRLRRMDAGERKAESRLTRLRSELDAALAALASLRDRQTSVSLAGPVLDGTAPATVGDYVFPVGGGPDVVSVGHTHHDYPAADIAAPEGSPLYALADSIVTEAYPDGSGGCGTGLKLRTGDGAVFVYCHLSYLEPGVVAGAALSAGAPVGLVGSTGNSTGPHLHLAFDPALTYPQEEAWFKAFAGQAFSWQDAPTPKPVASGARPRTTAPASGPVFRIVPPTRVVHFTRRGA